MISVSLLGCVSKMRTRVKMMVMCRAVDEPKSSLRFLA